jgi:hypothetical protein
MFPDLDLRRGAAGLAVVAGLVLMAGCEPDADSNSASADQALVKRYCVDCHNDAEAAGDLTLEGRDFANIAHDGPVWERVVRKLRAGMMPPSGEPRPSSADTDAFATRLASSLDTAARLEPNPGRTEAIHRLNRTEYRNAVRDLLALDIDVETLLPGDDVSYGFDNIAGVLKISPTLLERYLTAAEKVSRTAVGTATPSPDINWFRVADDRSQERRLPGLPFGTRGGTRIMHTFPMDAEYMFDVELARNLNESLPVYIESHDLEVSIDGERVALFTLPGVGTPQPAPQPANDGDASAPPAPPPISQIDEGPRLSFAQRKARDRIDDTWQVRVPVTAGRHDVTVTFIAKTAALDETLRLPFLRPYPSGVNIPETRMGAYLRSVEISGPYDAAGPGDSPSRQRIFSCRPQAPESPLGAESECAAEVLQTLARRAYRRPVNSDDLAPLMAFFEEGRANGSFDDGIQLAIKRLLVDPKFLFRIERDPDAAAPGSIYAIDGLELASRLSFFLWSSLPDDELIELGASDELSNPAVLENQVKRMLADKRADAFIENFAGQWLFLRNLDAVVPVQSIFPDFDDTLRQGFKRETELFFGSIVREDRDVHELLTADYTFLNERVARHYGIGEIKGSHFRRVQLPASMPRRGLLGQGSILTVTSYPDRTSPVIRGKWILENLLGTPPPPPAPNVPPLVDTDGAGAVISMRERLAVHRAAPACASCHQLMDPLGFALENFDAVGRWRTLGDAGESIDASGALPNGTEFDGSQGLRDALLSSDRFLETFTEKLMTYALGRGLEYYDQPTVRAIVSNAAAEDYRFSEFVIGAVQSPAFLMRRSN